MADLFGDEDITEKRTKKMDEKTLNEKTKKDKNSKRPDKNKIEKSKKVETNKGIKKLKEKLKTVKENQPTQIAEPKLPKETFYIYKHMRIIEQA